MAPAQGMKDTELRGLLLQAFYERRQAQSIESPTADWIDGKASCDEIYRICEQLGDHGLIKWDRFIGGGGVGIITVIGVDVIEGGRSSPDIAVQLVQLITNNNKVSNSSNVIVGNNNSQTVMNAFEEILRAIESSSSDTASKAKSKSLLDQLAGSPVIAQIIGQATKFGLDHLN